jgi:2-polyprenyl-6-methoxyphenol hydroxylase-like FAD-dependent oxidoreductase
VVIGASIAGLLAARVLVERFERVVVLERDVLAPVGEPRRAIPQGRHAHVLLASGGDALEDLLPGFAAQAVAAGALTMQPLVDMRFTVAGHRLPRVPVGPRAVLATRPLFEGLIAKHVRGLPRVEVRERCEVHGLVAAGDRVTGVRVRGRGARDERILPADVVVAANGRAAQAPAWLSALGFPAPPEEQLRLELRYVTRPLRLPAGALGGDHMVAATPRPGCARAATLLEQEHGRWLVTAQGYGGDRPPPDPAGLLRYLEPVFDPEVLEALGRAEWLGEPAVHGFRAGRRRRYERLGDRPQGLLVMGDAACSFNPVYGQGMSVAALEAVALARCLEGGDAALAARFHAAVADVVDQPWRLALLADLALPEVAAPRSPAVRLQTGYVRRLQRAAERDGRLAAAFVRVMALLDPASVLMKPDMVLRVLAGGRLADLEYRGWSRRPTARGR